MEREQVVAMWRPDEDRPYFLDGRWAAEAQLYYRDELPKKDYSGQGVWPLPFFETVAEAVAYLGERRPHTACQVGAKDFRRRWPNFDLKAPADRGAS